MTEPDFVRLVEVVDAPRDRVFAAWTEPARLEQWWGPGRFRTTRAEVDLRPGGRYELVLEPGPMHLGAGWASGLEKLRAHLQPEEVA